MSRLAPIYTIYGLLYTTFGLGGRHTGQAGYLASLLGALGDVEDMKRMGKEQLFNQTHRGSL